MPSFAFIGVTSAVKTPRKAEAGLVLVFICGSFRPVASRWF
jgi:hypothetical protein